VSIDEGKEADMSICDDAKLKHSHNTCVECGAPVVLVVTPGYAIAVHDDGSICEAAVTFQHPTYTPGSRPDLHNKANKTGSRARDYQHGK
jgi:hypothetical protein